MDESLVVNQHVTIPASELSWQYSRAGGPGGQHVNKSETRVQLSFDIASSPSISDMFRARAIERLGKKLVDGVLTVTVSDTRSQAQNRSIAAERMTAWLFDAFAPPQRARKPTRPSRSAKAKRLDTKRIRGEVKKGRRPPSDRDP